VFSPDLSMTPSSLSGIILCDSPMLLPHWIQWSCIWLVFLFLAVLFTVIAICKCDVCGFIMLYFILSHVGVSINRGLGWILDLLTTYIHDTELQAITAPPLITIHKSP
jgi:hypothetical protein